MRAVGAVSQDVGRALLRSDVGWRAGIFCVHRRPGNRYGEVRSQILFTLCTSHKKGTVMDTIIYYLEAGKRESWTFCTDGFLSCPHRIMRLSVTSSLTLWRMRQSVLERSGHWKWMRETIVCILCRHPLKKICKQKWNTYTELGKRVIMKKKIFNNV